MLRTHPSHLAARIDEHGLEVGRLAALHGPTELFRDVLACLRGTGSVKWRPKSSAFERPDARSAAAFMCTNLPATSCRLAGTTRLSTKRRSTSCKRFGIAIAMLDHLFPMRQQSDADCLAAPAGTTAPGTHLEA